MKHTYTLTLIALSFALLPAVAAEPSALHPSAAAAEQAAQRAAEYACTALSRPLPGGGHCCVAGGGSVMRSARHIAQKYPEAGIGVPVPVPENRVTAALNCPEACGLPPDWYDDKFKPLWSADVAIPADKVRELWYAALETLEIPISWFCDEAGDNLVIVTGGAANCEYDEMYHYQWDAEKQAFVRRAVCTYTSELLVLIPTMVEFVPEGMRVGALYVTEKGNTLQHRHLFRYADEKQYVEFPDSEIWQKLIKM